MYFDVKRIKERALRVILLGGPGAGKGTQASFMCRHYRIPQISTGDMLRAAVNAGTGMGRRVKQVMDSGLLVSDDIIITLVKDRLERPDCQRGYLFDGFPRTVPQACALRDRAIVVDAVVELRVEDAEIVHRISGRRVHPESGRTYHIEFNPPTTPGKDDVTGEELIQRDDDREATVRKRLEVYHDQTEPLIAFYSDWSHSGDEIAPKYVCVDGKNAVGRIRDDILAALG